jgi:drug/metabolite transporter (DMT)-like permease
MQASLGVALACIASILFNIALVLQTHETRLAPAEQALRLSLLRSLAQRRRWLAGLALQVVGMGLQIAALSLAPLTAVQPADAVGLLYLLYLGSHDLGEVVGRRELLAAMSIVLGVVGLALAAPNRRVVDLNAPKISVWLALGALALIAIVPYLLRNSRGAGSWLTVLGAGCAFALTAFCAKLVADSLATQAWGTLVVVVVIAAFGATTGTVSEMSALQRRQAIQVAPVIFVIELLVPVALAVTVVGEHWGSSSVIIGVCLALVTTGTIALGRTPSIAKLIASRDPDSGGVPSE